MNTMRVFLHDLLWQQDSAGFTRRIDQFLAICARHGIRPMFVLFDSVWDPYPALGRQPQPRAGVHNSGWMQAPGVIALSDPRQYARLEQYVKGVIGAFKDDRRILAWDLWNEPDNMNNGSYGAGEPKNKVDLVVSLLAKVFAWARAAGPSQPLTSGVWKGDYSSPDKLDATQKIQLESSDVISFHSYDRAEEFEKRVDWLERYDRPILCTEYMARGNGSTFQGTLPVASRRHVAAINWGLVAGKTQTFFPWDSWQNPYIGREPSIWFHEVFRTDGTPVNPEETGLIKTITAAGKAVPAGVGR
jgi:hypothetical protein